MYKLRLRLWRVFTRPSNHFQMPESFASDGCSADLDLELESVTRPVNAIFDEISYDTCEFEETDYGVTVTVLGTYSGYSLDDDDPTDPTIDFEVTVYLRRCAGRVSFAEPEIYVEGVLRCDDDAAKETAQDALPSGTRIANVPGSSTS